MAKGKNKKVGWDRPAEEVNPGAWEWQAGPFFWHWFGVPGINLCVKIGEEFKGVCYAKDLKEAGMFAEGFAAGVRAAAMLAQQANKIDQQAAADSGA